MIPGITRKLSLASRKLGRSMEPTFDPVKGIKNPVNNICTPNPFEQLVRILRMNERLLGELQRLNGRLDQARDYLVRPGANVVLGMATLARAKQRRSAVLCRLRAHRIEADRILGGRQWREAGV